MQSKLELDFSECDGSAQEQNCREITDWMGRKIQFRSVEHKEAYERLTARQKQYIASYMVNAKRQDIGKEVGVNGSSETIGKTLQSIAKRMRLQLRDLKSIKTGDATAGQLKKIMESQGYRCALSGEELSPDTARLDHKLAVSLGGSNDIENLQWLDVEVNRMKGALTQERFIELCRKITQWTS